MVASLLSMKTVAKIDPEKEYETAKKIIEAAIKKDRLDIDMATSLDSSVDNLITAARILIEREERRRGKKSPPKVLKPKGRTKGDKRQDSNKLPSKRYPDLEMKEDIVYPEQPPHCPCCNEIMKESGLYDTSEKIEVIPKKYYIQRNKRPKFRCSKCHGAMVNTQAVPSVTPTSNYGDSLFIDVALSKYCDLIPIERYAQIAIRSGLPSLPPQSLIELTHHLAYFLFPVYDAIREEVLSASILQADETPHNMLEGDDTKNWYLWGFFSLTACYFEAHNTRSGDVVYEVLKESAAEYLVTDGYAGYSKARRIIKEKYDRDIIEVNCNAHAYRYFEDAGIRWEAETKTFLDLYGRIYELERKRKELENKLSDEEQLKYRGQMLPLFEQIKKNCEEQQENAMPESTLKKSINYYLNQYEGLVLCTTNIAIPLDNNLSEREMRAPVVGRKTWYGTHSKKGAHTTAILFTIVQSCKLNNVNPRNYFPWIVNCIHKGESILSPHEYFKRSPPLR